MRDIREMVPQRRKSVARIRVEVDAQVLCCWIGLGKEAVERRGDDTQKTYFITALLFVSMSL